jgi:hypothetical protein
MQSVLEPNTQPTLARPKGSPHRRSGDRRRRPQPDRPPVGPEGTTVELPKSPAAPPEPMTNHVPPERVPGTDDRRGLRL